MTGIRYCRSCPPGTATRLNRFNKGDVCGPCEKARRDRWLARARAEAEAERDAESLRDAILRELRASEPLTNRRLAELTGHSPAAVRMETKRLRDAGTIEFATMICGINRYRLAEQTEERAA